MFPVCIYKLQGLSLFQTSNSKENKQKNIVNFLQKFRSNSEYGCQYYIWLICQIEFVFKYWIIRADTDIMFSQLKFQIDTFYVDYNLYERLMLYKDSSTFTCLT